MGTYKKDISHIQATEMKFLRSVKGCTRMDRLHNESIRNELEIFSIVDKLEEHKYQWKEHLDRMDNTRLPKKINTYKPHGKRSLGRPRKRWT